MSIPDWFRAWTAWAGDERWILWLVVILVAVIAVDAIHRGLMRLFAGRARRSRHAWDDAVIHALGGPVSLIFWVLGLAAAAAVIGAQLELPIDLPRYISRGMGIGIVIALTWFGFRLARGVEDTLVQRYVARQAKSGPDRTTIEGIGKVLRATAIGIGLLLILQALGVSISALLAAGGVVGIAIAVAAGGLLSNFFGSMMIHMDGPFKVGDWIRSPERDIEGVVEYVGWRVTRLRTFDMRPLYVPNSIFVSAVIENPSRMTHRRIYEHVAIRYDDIAVLGNITGAIRERIEAREEVDLHQPVIVNFLTYGESSLTILIHCLVTETRWMAYHALKQGVLLDIATVVGDHGARVAYPTTTLHLASTPGGEPVAAPDIEDTDAGARRSAESTYGDAEGGKGDGA